MNLDWQPQRGTASPPDLSNLPSVSALTLLHVPARCFPRVSGYNLVGLLPVFPIDLVFVALLV